MSWSAGAEPDLLVWNGATLASVRVGKGAFVSVGETVVVRTTAVARSDALFCTVRLLLVIAGAGCCVVGLLREFCNWAPAGVFLALAFSTGCASTTGRCGSGLVVRVG